MPWSIFRKQNNNRNDGNKRNRKYSLYKWLIKHLVCCQAERRERLNRTFLALSKFWRCWITEKKRVFRDTHTAVWCNIVIATMKQFRKATSQFWNSTSRSAIHTVFSQMTRASLIIEHCLRRNNQRLFPLHWKALLFLSDNSIQKRQKCKYPSINYEISNNVVRPSLEQCVTSKRDL